MNRRHVLFGCEGSTLAGTLDDAAGGTALLIVSGGNELRCGAWGGQSQIAAALAALGHPVFRFDRRGVGDSEGPNAGFRRSGPDIAAALAALRSQCPHVRRIVAYGNCDAASALMLSGGAGFDGMVLSNPWTIDEAGGGENPDDQVSAAAARAHYRRRLADPAAIRRLLSGKVSLSKLFAGLRRAAAAKAGRSRLAVEMARELASFGGPVRILIAGRDRTAQEFLAQWDRRDWRIATCPQASHSFVEPDARDWLLTQLKAALADQG